MKLSNLQLRAVTGFFFVAIMLTGVFFQWSLLAITLIIFSIGCFELARMFLIQKAINYTYCIFATLILSAYLLSKNPQITFFYNQKIDTATAFMLLLITIILISGIFFKQLNIPQKLWMNGGVIYIFIGCVSFYLLGMRGIDEAESVKMNPVIWVLIITWSNDVFAYLVGRKIGKHPLAPSISPKKTIEGTVGGLMFAGIAAVIFENKDLHGPYIWNNFFIGILIGVAATVGDLIESKAKRTANVKDSGTILPGHGGILDRFDAMLLTMPVAYCLLILFSM